MDWEAIKKEDWSRVSNPFIFRMDQWMVSFWKWFWFPIDVSLFIPCWALYWIFWVYNKKINPVDDTNTLNYWTPKK